MPGRNVLLGVVAATLLAGCGSDDGTIPRDDAENLLAQLEAIENNVAQGECPSALAQANEYASAVDQLPSSVESEVRRGLEQSADQLVNLTANDCEPETNTTDEGGVVPETEQTTSEPPPETETETTTEEATTEDQSSDDESVEPQTDDVQQDQDLAPGSGNQGLGGGNAGSDGGVGPSGGVGSGGGG